MSKEARSEGSNLPEGGGDRMRGVGIPGRKNSRSRHFAVLGNPRAVSICVVQEQPTPIRSFVVTVKGKEVEVSLKSAFKGLRKFQLCCRRQVQRGSRKSAL